MKPIIEKAGNFNQVVPNNAYYIFKNRGGKWKSIIVWTNVNYGNMREVDCFVTTNNYELITEIEKTELIFEGQ